MRKNIKKAIGAAVCAAVVGGLAIAPACGGYYNNNKLDGNIGGEVSSNGGFVVEKGDYVYFVNGVYDYTADNSYGEVVKGAIMRIAVSDLDAGNYASAETVVPQMYYSGNYDSGLFIYGDYIYYSTPSTDRNSDGVVQNTYLDFKSSKLDGTEAMRGYYYQSSSNSIEYRYVQIDGVVYLLYSASEDLYDTGSTYTNLHSLNTVTGVNTLLAYNVSSYYFDDSDPESGVVYYTMSVTEGIGGSNSSSKSYNQIYRVTADDTTPNSYDFSYITDYDAETDPVYVNCGELVLDGIGKTDANSPTQFNARGADGDYSDVDHPAYTYAINSYSDGRLYYTRTATAEMMFTLDDGELAAGYDAVNANPAVSKAFIIDASSATDYIFLNIGDETKALYVENYRFMLGTVVDGKVVNMYCLTNDAATADPTVLFTEGSYLYYALSGTNDNTVYRVNYTGSPEDYNTLESVSGYTDYKSVGILDIEYMSDWFAPEIIDGTLFFASQTDQMGSYNYIMACDLSGNCDDGVMSNSDINDYNTRYQDVLDAIDEVSADDYEHLSSALRYLFYTGDDEYLAELIQAYVDIEGRNEEYLYSRQSAQIYLDFKNAAKGDIDWSEYATAENTKKINGEDVHANARDYYYAVVGKMTDADYEAYRELLRDEYMQAYPEKTQTTWWEGLNTAAKACFIAGMCVAGALIIAGATIITVKVVKRRKTDDGQSGAKKIKVDITDDKSIDVYGDGESKPENND